MEKLDRLGWAAGMSFEAYGVRIGIRVTQPEVLDEMAPYLPYGWKPTASPVVEELYSLKVGGAGPRAGLRRYHLLYGGGTQVARTMDLTQVFLTLENYLQINVADRARRRVFVHAGVVGWRGRAILIPGGSYSGKSSLVAALVRAGASYYSDDFAVLDGWGRVHPYPRPLSLRDGTEGPARKLTAEDLGGRAGDRPLPVGLVVVTRYRPGARWRPRPLTPGQAVLALFANTVPARRKPQVALRALQRAVAGSPALEGVRGEAEDVAQAILENLSP